MPAILEYSDDQKAWSTSLGVEVANRGPQRRFEIWRRVADKYLEKGPISHLHGEIFPAWYLLVIMKGAGVGECSDAKEIQVRSANESDLDCLLEMTLKLQGHVEASNPSIWRLSPLGRRQLKTEMIEAMEDPDRKVMIAVVTGREGVAFAIGRVAPRERYLGGNVGYIEKLYVGNHWRRRGVGSRLVRALLRFFLDRGADDVSLRYVVGNIEAERFWKGLGFRPRIEIAGVDPETLAWNLGEKGGN